MLIIELLGAFILQN